MQRDSVILDQGCDINALDEAGHSPLFSVIAGYHVQTVNLLLQRGADPNLRDEATNGFSPLDWAIMLKARNRKPERIETVRLLVVHGADPSIRTWMQNNAFDRLNDSHVLQEIRDLVLNK